MINKNNKCYKLLENILKWGIRLVFFVLWPALFSTSFTGVKNIVEMMAENTPLSMNPFMETLLVLLVVTIVFGRIFCGFFCAFGTYGDLIYGMSTFLHKKFGKKGKKRPLSLFHKYGGILRYGKYIVLCGVLFFVYAGYGSQIASYSPFSAFSRLHSLNWPDSTVGIVLFLIITVGMAMEPRFFCRFLCPMGAVFSLLPILPFAAIKRNRDNCINKCQACKNVCPAGIDIASDEEGDNGWTGECFACGKCKSICPRKNIHKPFELEIFYKIWDKQMKKSYQKNEKRIEK